MEDSSRAIVVIAVATLVLAPLMNGILDEAAATADRLFLKDTKWEGDPPPFLPDDPPDGEPPEGDGEPPDDLPEDLEGEFQGPPPNCQPQEEYAVTVNRTSPQGDEGPLQAVAQRVDPQTQYPFMVEDRHFGMGIGLRITEGAGPMSARVYPADDPDAEVWAWDNQNAMPDDYQSSSVERRPELVSGEWVAELNVQSATYDALEFVVALATCAGSE